MAEAKEPTSTQCVFCWSKDKQLVDPRVLPCSHVSCKACLDGQLEAQKVVWCKNCEKVFDVVIDELPTYKLPKAKHECEVCHKKGNNVSAVIYCNTCNKKLCGAHREWHDELHDYHTTLTIRQYEEQAKRLETKYCTKHKMEGYILGCDNCLKVFCASCICLTNTCERGQAHALINLPDLVNRLTSKIDELVAAIVSQEEELSMLFKEASKVASEFGKETNSMLKQLHDTRDVQIQAIKDKYNDLEEKLTESRRKTQEQMTEFMEESVGAMLTNLSNKRADLEARMKNNHQVDTIQQYREMQRQADQLSKSALPSLKIKYVQKLSFKDENHNINVESVAADKIYISPRGISSAISSPKSCTLVKELKTDSFCHAVCHYKNKTYVGTQKCTIDVIDSTYKQTTIVTLNYNHWPYGIYIHDDKIYSLVTNNGKPCTVNVYDLTGKLINRWDRDDRTHFVRATVVSDKVVVGDYAAGEITVYSNIGQTEKVITCSMLGANTSICKADSQSIIVTSYQHSIVKRINISSGLTEWECREITKPQALSLCGDDLVGVFRDNELAILNSQSGKLVTKLTVPAVTRVSFYIDIDISDNILIASSENGKPTKLVYYSLNG